MIEQVTPYRGVRAILFLSNRKTSLLFVFRAATRACARDNFDFWTGNHWSLNRVWMRETAARGAPASSHLATRRMCITAQPRVPGFHSRLLFELRGHFQTIVSCLEHPMSKKRKTPDDNDGGGGGEGRAGGGGGGEFARAEDFLHSSCADQGMKTRTVTGDLTQTFDREPVTAGDVHKRHW